MSPGAATRARGETPPGVELVLHASLALSVVHAVWLVWFHLNPLQVDVAGHIASAKLFADGRFHGYVYEFFQGYVANLSYPPLEDALLGGLGRVFGGNWLVAFRVYLTVLLIAYSTAFVALSRALPRGFGRLVILTAGLVLLHVRKDGSGVLQGLGIYDALVTGLTAEILATIFLLLALRTLVRGGKPSGLALVLGLALSSHLVVGPVAILLACTFAVVGQRRELWKSVALAVGWNAYFLVPFLANRGSTYVSTIFGAQPALIAGLLAVLAAVGWSNRVARALSLVGLFLVLPTELLGGSRGAGALLPAFHYYRLSVFGLLFAFVTVAVVLASTPRSSTARRVASVAFVALVVTVARYPGFQVYDTSGRAFRDSGFAEVAWPADPEGRRTWTITPERPSDFYIDAMAVTRGGRAAFAKGLYWEASRDNVTLSSYLAQLLAPVNIVLDYTTYRSSSCDVTGRVLDGFLRDFAIGTIVAPEHLRTEYLPDPRRSCLDMLLRRGSARFDFVDEGGFELDGVGYVRVGVRPKDPSWTNGVVEVIDPESVVTVPRNARIDDLVLGSHVRRRADETPPTYAYEAPPETDRPGALTARRSVAPHPDAGPDGLEVDVDTRAPVLVKLKVSAVPGLRLVDSTGRDLPLIEAPNSILTVGRGRIRLQYGRPTSAWVGYAMTLAVLLTWIGLRAPWPVRAGAA